MTKNPITRPIAALAGILAALYPAWCWAADGPANWRHIYDTVMMWVNFVILVLLLIKFLRPPALKFLRAYKQDLKSEMDKLTSQKEKAAQELEIFKESIQDRRKHWENRYQKILAQGERDRQTLIIEAQAQAHRMMENADRQIEARVRDASQKLRSEIVDKAIAVASEELPGRMNPEIESHWLRLFLKGITKASAPNQQ
jgi:F-type H+-transporting ATPase subunit b